MPFKYLWHHHPLQYTSVVSDQFCCFVCLDPVQAYCVGCSRRPICNSFFLHISCFQLPHESLHPLHPQHRLTLLPDPPDGAGDGIRALCVDCRSPCSGFTYHCSLCSFSLHLRCASRQRSFKFEFHKHPLTFFPSPQGFVEFRCFVCADSGRGFNLACNACDLTIHVECAAYPVNVTSGDHHRHQLCLTSVRSIDDGPGEFYCDLVCEEEVNPKGCVYHCAECNYMAHLGCVASAPKPHVRICYQDSADISSAEIVDEEELEPETNALGNSYQPELGKIGEIDDAGLIKIRKRFVQLRITEKSQPENESGAQTDGRGVRLEHFSHPHPLWVGGKHNKDKVNCPMCWEQIPGLSYGCDQCNYFLHQWCANLPQKIQHPLHPDHPLTLLSRALPYARCNACEESCDAFCFTFSCQPCGFHLHAMCGSIPSILRSGIHRHPLFLRQKRPYSARCSACREEIRTGVVFECEMCNLELDLKCALLPHKIRHRSHVDPLFLSYVPVKDDESDEFYCNACENLRDPSHWVYYCAECEYCAHMNCVVSELLGGRPSPGLLGYNHHEHLLSLITNSSVNPT